MPERVLRLDTMAIAGTNYPQGRMTEAYWGHPDPSVCPAGELAERYQYTQGGLIHIKRLSVSRNHTYNGATFPVTGHLDAVFNFDNEGRQIYEVYPYPSEKIFEVASPHFQIQYDAAGRLASLNKSTSITYPVTFAPLVNNVSYNAAGQMQSLNYLGYTQTRSYNERLQLTRLTASGASLPAVDLEYRYSATQNDGRITQEKNWVSGEEVTYQYDELQRLVSAATTGPEWGLSFSYDGFGTKLAQTITKGTAPPHSVVVNAANNRIAGWSYDANGNATQMGAGTRLFSYDVENRVEADDQGRKYSYGPDNRRIWDGVAFTFWAPDGRRLGRYKVTAASVHPQQGWYRSFTTVETQVYFAGMQVGVGGGQYGNYQPVVVDRLGSVRVRGTQQMSYWPYGEERTATAQGQDKFGTYLREAGGLDYAVNQYYTSTLGRFLTADPYTSTTALTNPTVWNRYAYTGGDPINRYDPSGLEDEDPNDVRRAYELWYDFLKRIGQLGPGMASPVPDPFEGADFQGAHIVDNLAFKNTNNLGANQDLIRRTQAGIQSVCTSGLICSRQPDSFTTARILICMRMHRSLTPTCCGIGAIARSPASVTDLGKNNAPFDLLPVIEFYSRKCFRNSCPARMRYGVVCSAVFRSGPKRRLKRHRKSDVALQQ
ncbi:MAG: RHS repeat-associated core domain-containing protein [Bryobacteraceae bacterium]